MNLSNTELLSTDYQHWAQQEAHFGKLAEHATYFSPEEQQSIQARKAEAQRTARQYEAALKRVVSSEQVDSLRDEAKARGVSTGKLEVQIQLKAMPDKVQGATRNVVPPVLRIDTRFRNGNKPLNARSSTGQLAARERAHTPAPRHQPSQSFADRVTHPQGGVGAGFMKR